MKLFLSAACLAVLGSFILGYASAFMAPKYSATAPTALYMADTPTENKQKMYGESLELPETYVRCGRCHTVYAITPEDLGDRGKGCRLECSICQHSWFQARDRVMKLRDGMETVPLPDTEKERIALNLQEGRQAHFVGESKLYVGNISFDCQEADLMELFSEIGTVGDVSLVRDDQGRSRGFGFVTMRKSADGAKAMDDLDGTSVRGRNIAVRESTN